MSFCVSCYNGNTFVEAPSVGVIVLVIVDYMWTANVMAVDKFDK